MTKWVTAVVSAVAVASGIVTIVAFVQSKDSAETSVKASGEDAIAAGNDVRITEKNVVNEHDFDRDAQMEAERYLSVARGTCKKLSDRIAEMTVQSSLDMTQIQRVHPPELYPSEVVADHYGEQVYDNINTKIQGMLEAYQPALKPLMANAIGSMTGLGSKAREKSGSAEAFDRDKKVWLDRTNDLCSYLGSVGS